MYYERYGGRLIMWIDSASDIDMLFYEPYARLIANMARNKKYNPVTIGIFGLWGAGKSTLLNLIQKDLDDSKKAKNKILCVQVNAWMFEGYEDAKIALMETLLNELDAEEHKDLFSSVKTEIKGLFKRINYFKLGTDIVKKGIPVATALATGSPVPLLLSMPTGKEDIMTTLEKAKKGLQSFEDSYIKEKEDSTVENIRKFRIEFEKMLMNSDVDNVVVLVDDLDRCTPERIIETLEAIKLFLSVKGTTFIIAADETVIEYAIKKKYPRLEGSEVVLSNEYIEKIIQLPITIPDLSSKDIENYLLLLVAQLYLKEEAFSKLIEVIEKRHLAIREYSITLKELDELIGIVSSEPFETDKEEYCKDSMMIDAVKDIIATNLRGNPRQTKRFLNTFITKKELAQMYFGEDIDLKVMTKILVLQKISPDLFLQLNQWNREYVTCNEGLKDVYDKVIIEESTDEKYAQWRTSALIKWLKCDPIDIYKQRLDKYFYLTREKLKDTETSLSDLLPETKSILEQIGNASEANIDGVITDLNSCSPEAINQAIIAVLVKFNEKKIEMFVIKTMYSKCESYRRKIETELRNYDAKFELGDVPYFKAMLEIEPVKMQELLDVIKGNSLTLQLYNKIVKKKREK